MSPLYEYHCQACGNNFEKLRPMEEYNYPTGCLDCGARADRRISLVSLINGNPFFTDGEGFSTKFMRHEEVAEMNQETRNR